LRRFIAKSAEDKAVLAAELEDAGAVMQDTVVVVEVTSAKVLVTLGL
jgi:hypothetical protein